MFQRCTSSARSTIASNFCPVNAVSRFASRAASTSSSTNNHNVEAEAEDVKDELVDEEMPGPPPPPSFHEPSPLSSGPALQTLPPSEKDVMVMADSNIPIPSLGIPSIDALLSIPSYPSTPRECSDLLLIAAHHLNDTRSAHTSTQHSLSSAHTSLSSAQSSFASAQTSLSAFQLAVRAAEEEKNAAEKALRSAEEKLRAAQEKVVATYHQVRSAEASVHGATREVGIWEGMCKAAEEKARRVEEGWKLLDVKYGKIGRKHLRAEDVHRPAMGR